VVLRRCRGACEACAPDDGSVGFAADGSPTPGIIAEAVLMVWLLVLR
jgi:hypothetical protein